MTRWCRVTGIPIATIGYGNCCTFHRVNDSGYILNKILLTAILLALITPAFAQSVGGSGFEEGSVQDVDAAALLRSQAQAQSDASGVAPLGAREPARNSTRTTAPRVTLLDDSIKPFGANLFTGGFSADGEDGLNPSYTIQPGDRVSIRIWGATQFNQSLVVDHQGNIFIPGVGPVMLRNTQSTQLNERVSQAVSTVYTDNVRVYTNLDSSQPVAVFVTGYVPNPGRFAGIPSNSVLYFLDRAGGVDPSRGSYRRISVIRNRKNIANVDLYEFLISGEIESIQFRDGDTIVVGERGSSISVNGDIKNPALYELLDATVDGAAMQAMAMIAPDVNYVGISGVRGERLHSVYVPLEDFAAVQLFDGDEISFKADQHDQVIVVEVEGAHLGPSRYTVLPDTRLHELLDYIEVDQVLADTGSVSLKRKTIALRQKAALRESLQRLEASYLTASSQTDQESSIRAQEAQLIRQFIESARRVEPNGRLVVAKNSGIANVILQSGDTVSIPSRSESVLLSGEVLVSQAMLYSKGDSARDYIARSGGFNQQAERDRIVVVHANGEVSSGKNPDVRSGDEIIVLPKVPVKNLQLAATIVDIIYKVAVAASVAINL